MPRSSQVPAPFAGRYSRRSAPRSRWSGSITQEGRRAVEATEPLRLDLVEQIFGALDRDEADQLEKVLAKLGVALSVQEGGVEDSTLFRGIAVIEEKL